MTGAPPAPGAPDGYGECCAIAGAAAHNINSMFLQKGFRNCIVPSFLAPNGSEQAFYCSCGKCLPDYVMHLQKKSEY
jgi:hypothetical protein